MEKFDLYWITWKNQEALGKKIEDLTDSDFTIRPGLVLDKDIIVTIAKVTKHDPRLIFKNEYKIIKWLEAGLAVPSTIRFSKKELIPAHLITEANKIGHLADEDIQQIIKLKLIESLYESKEKLIEDLVFDYTYEDADKIFKLIKSEQNKEKEKYLRDILNKCLFELYMNEKTSDEWRHGKHNEIRGWLKANPLSEELLESKEEDILKARSIIADQIRGEWDADKGYTKAAADLAELKDIDTKEAQDMMLDIASEEHVHVGELETAYDAFDPKLFDELEDGHNEADENAEPANDLDYDIAEEPVAEGLDLDNEEECAWCHEKFPESDVKFEKDFGPLCHQCIQAIKSHEGEDSLEFEEALKESIESDQIEKIENYIERLYDLRKKSIAEDGEYGLGNLVFKEIRNKGYLDNLREIKFKLKSKDLSLE